MAPGRSRTRAWLHRTPFRVTHTPFTHFFRFTHRVASASPAHAHHPCIPPAPSPHAARSRRPLLATTRAQRHIAGAHRDAHCTYVRIAAAAVAHARHSERGTRLRRRVKERRRRVTRTEHRRTKPPLSGLGALYTGSQGSPGRATFVERCRAGCSSHPSPRHFGLLRAAGPSAGTRASAHQLEQARHRAAHWRRARGFRRRRRHARRDGRCHCEAVAEERLQHTDEWVVASPVCGQLDSSRHTTD